MAAPTPPQPALLPPLLLLLSVTTGLVDATSVLGLGKVFTANMTGNIVFLGFAAVGTPGFTIAPYVIAIATFMLGAFVAGRTGRFHTNRPLRHWLLWSALIEAVLLWAAAVVAIGFDPASLMPEWKLFMIIALTAVAMGYRNATIRQLKVPDLTTTVLTLTITGLAADSTLAGGSNPNWARRIAAVVAILLGAALGAVLVRYGLAVPLAVAGALILGGTIACTLHEDAGKPLGA
ncbi:MULTISPECIES: YoaK family protein [Sphingomonas]|jgi:uncharacterized membrane protein YoaK (UPF0700 family)|uniref:YoaK family protein n=1 Tax=Sphingomonas TaxID=13687 RepID=UPI001AE4CEFE